MPTREVRKDPKKFEEAMKRVTPTEGKRAPIPPGQSTYVPPGTPSFEVPSGKKGRKKA